MKRILHMTPPEIKNGVYRYIFNHMPCINQEDYQFCFLTKNAEELLDSPEHERFNFPVYKLNSVQRNGREAFIKEIKGILSEGFDVVHLHSSAWRGFLIEEVAMEMGIGKVIVHSHSTGIDFESQEERDTIRREHEYYKKRFTMEYATDLCACSELAADWLFSEAIPRDCIKILPNAIDARKFAFNREIRDRLRKKLGIQYKTVFGHIGRYSYTKNQIFLVDAFFEACKTNRNLYLIMIGQGENINRVKRHVQSLGMESCVKCFSWTDNVVEYMQAIDVFCLPSRFEGFPISVVEAQAAGLRCLVSDKVTNEVNLTGDVTFLPLIMEEWRDSFLHMESNYERRENIGILENAGFTIESSSKKLCALYDGLL